ncbi:hypothetical protein BH11MYX4_BH11MYX4_02300 [soil metagenome]
MLADDEGRKLGRPLFNEQERHNARRRRERRQEALARTPEGLLALERTARLVEAGRTTARIFARSGVEFRPAVADGFKRAVEAIEEYGLHSRTAQGQATTYGLLLAVGLHLQADAGENGTRIATSGKSVTDDKGVRASIGISGFRDLGQLSLAYVSKAAVCLEMSFRSEDRWRQEEQARARDRQRQARIVQAELQRTVTGPAALAEPEPAEPAEPEQPDLVRPEPEPASPAPMQHAIPPRRPVLTPREAFAWCPNRHAHVPASIAGTPLRSAAIVPRATVEKMKREGQAIPANWMVEPEPEAGDES